MRRIGSACGGVGSGALLVAVLVAVLAASGCGGASPDVAGSGSGGPAPSKTTSQEPAPTSHGACRMVSIDFPAGVAGKGTVDEAFRAVAASEPLVSPPEPSAWTLTRPSDNEAVFTRGNDVVRLARSPAGGWLAGEVRTCA